MNDVLRVIVQFLVVLFAISVHESAHAWAANKFGDPTARLQGRISLNPIAHIDLLGTIIFPLLMALMHAPVFGWAKPVMVNPYNLRNPKRDGMFIAAAGPVSNLLVGSFSILVFLLIRDTALIRSIPVLTILLYLIMINIYLAIFNLIPIPPLDGSGILEGVLKGEALSVYERIKPYGFIILLAIIYLNVLDFVARPILAVVMNIIGVN